MLRLKKNNDFLLTEEKDAFEDEKQEGQAMLEFCFSMIIVFLLIYGTMMTLRWTGMDLAQRRIAHDNVLLTPIIESYLNRESSPMRQVETSFYGNPFPMNTIWMGAGNGL